MALVEVERADGAAVARVVLTRPDQRNAVSNRMLEELVSTFGALAVDPGLRAVILSGRGPDFCAGADLADVTIMSADADYGRSFEEVVTAVETLPSPVIAEVHGAALGAGCQLVVACDLAVAAEDARLGIPSARLGLLINYENLERLVLAVGRKRAGELLYAGRVLTGVEAVEWGLVTKAVPADKLAETVQKLAERIADLAPLSVRGSKRGVTAVSLNLALDRTTEGHRIADFGMMAAEAFQSEDLREGLAAFRERRDPRFQGR